MKLQSRWYHALLDEALTTDRQMAFVTGPRQVGKTTLCRDLSDVYLDWDNEDHREIILGGPAAVAAHAGLDTLRNRPIRIVFDELHKYKRWKQFLKGFFDTYEAKVRIMVTGSSRLDVYRKGGDSLMGRYFLYRMHPFTVAELCRPEVSEALYRDPMRLDDAGWQVLWEHGGHPEPFIKRSPRFSLRWRELRRHQLLREDIRDMTGIQDLDQFAIMARLLAEQSGGQLIYSTLAKQIRVSENTVRSWVATLCAFHYGFLVRPWFKNVAKALRKEPKWFLRDWSGIGDPGQRAETFCACHLLKAVEGWTDLGLGVFDLRYIRDTQKREVDFVVIRDGNPWFLVEVKHGQSALSPHLAYFQNETNAQHAFQISMQADYVGANCFEHTAPIVVPAKTFFSQLV
ncbi:MAG: AAA family ATPase [Kiritimatiellae bacterium]|nr:AAA family ATPase [Kiritimatiellia bacterium]